MDDDGNVLIRFKGGARGIIYASQVSNGDENDLNIRVYGTKKSIEWHQEEPNDLIVKDARTPRQIYRRGNGYITGAAVEHTRIPFGHPEVLSKLLPMFTIVLRLRLKMKLRENFPANQVVTFLIFGMALLEWHLSKPL